MKHKSKHDRRLSERLQNPQNDADEDFAGQHIREESARIREGWSDKQMAKSSGTSLEPYELPVIPVGSLGVRD